MTIHSGSVPHRMDELSREKVAQLVEETPPSGPQRRVAFVAAVATLGSLLFGYDTGVISGALPYMYMPQEAGGLALNALEEGLVGGILLIGCAVGASSGGRWADARGRRSSILWLALLFFIGAVACAISPNVWILYVARFVLGLAVGGASAVVPVYLAETAPPKIRGSLVAVDQLMIVTGQLLAFVMNAILANTRGGPQAVVAGDASQTPVSWDILQHSAGVQIAGGNGSTWRYMLILASLPAIFLWIGMRMMPESSRWYAANLRLPEAIGALKRVRTERDDVTGEINEMIEAHRLEESSERLTLSQGMKVPWIRAIIVIGCSLAMLQQLTGVNTMMYYAPKVLMAAGFSSQVSITLNIFTGVASVIGSAAALYTLSRFGRRGVLLFGQIGLTIMLFAMTAVFFFGISPHLHEDGSVDASMPTAVPYLVVVVIAVYMLCMQSGPGPATWVLLSEIFPAAVRGAAIGFAVTCMWVMNAAITFVFPVMMDILGPVATYLIFSIVNVLATIYYVVKIPETKHATLEELEAEFKVKYS